MIFSDISYQGILRGHRRTPVHVNEHARVLGDTCYQYVLSWTRVRAWTLSRIPVPSMGK